MCSASYNRFMKNKVYPESFKFFELQQHYVYIKKQDGIKYQGQFRRRHNVTEIQGQLYLFCEDRTADF